MCVMWDALQHVDGSLAVDGVQNRKGKLGEMIFSGIQQLFIKQAWQVVF